MKRLLSFLLVLLFHSTVFAQSTLQGQVHPSWKGSVESAPTQLKSDPNFSFDDILFWVGEGENKAALVIEWHDGKTPDAIVWGYRWNGTASGHDMIMAIAKADPRILFLTQLTGWMGYTIDGIGYSEQLIPLSYDLAGAAKDPHVSFKFNQPNIPMGQMSVPANPAQDALNAIRQGWLTGIIVHPFNYTIYGYPAYDYDHWQSQSSDAHWSAGWYEGYWSYFVKDNIKDVFSYSGWGATSRQLVNGSWDAWSYNADMTTMSGTNPGNKFVAATIPSDQERGVFIDQEQIKLALDETSQLTAYVCRENATNKSVTWQSSNDKVVSVDANGRIRGLAGGTATIIVRTTDRGHTASCTVTVGDPDIRVTGLSLSQSASLLEIGQTLLLSAYVSPSNASNQQISWKSSNNTVATISEGLVTAKQAGEAIITATTEDGGFTASCKITVTMSKIIDVKVKGTTATITMPKIPQATSYEIYLFKPDNGKNELVNLYVADAEGNIRTKSTLQSEEATFSFTIDGLKTSVNYLLQIRPMKGLEIIDTYYTSIFSIPVGSEPVNRQNPKAYYADGTLFFTDCEGYKFRLINKSGQLQKIFNLTTQKEQVTLVLPKDLYFLLGEKGTIKTCIKLIINK